MNEQVIAFLLKYQEMREAKKAYQKNAQSHLINKVMKLELELDELAPKILAALDLK